MLKRFLALFATVAIVVSMFSGVVFANSRLRQDPGFTGGTELEYLVTNNKLLIKGDYADIPYVANLYGDAAKWVGVEIERPAADYDLVDLSGFGETDYTDLTLDGSGDVLWLYFGADPEGNKFNLTLTWKDSATTDPADDYVENIVIEYRNTGAAAVKLDGSEFIYGDSAGQEELLTYAVTGRIVDQYGRSIGGNYQYKIEKDAIDVTTGLIINGVIDTDLTNLELDNITGLNPLGQYTLKVWPVGTGYSEDDAITATFELKYDLELEELNLTFGDTDVVVKGYLRDGYGDGVEGAEILIPCFDTTTPSTVTTSSTGRILFIGNEVTTAGEIEVSVDGYVYTTIEVAEKGLDITFEADTLTAGLPCTISELVAKDGDAEITATFTVDYDNDDTDEEITVNDTIIFAEAGTYTVKAEAEGYYGELDITVAAQGETTLLIPTTTIDAGTDTTWTVGDSNQVKIVVKDQEGTTTKYVVEAVGPGIELEHDTAVDGNTITLSPTQAGEIELTVKKYIDGELAATKTATITVSGYNYEISRSEFVFGDEYTVKVTVTDDEGNPVNNATIKFGDTVVADYTSNPNNGVYTIEIGEEGFEFAAPGKYALVVEDAESAVMVSDPEALTVTGEETYFITDLNVDTLVAGVEQKVTFRIVDAYGDEVLPANVEAVIDETSVKEAVLFDSDEDGIDDTYKFTFDGSEAVNVEIRAYNSYASFDEATEVGSAEVEVVLPTVNVTEMVTENFKSVVALEFINPVTGEALEATVDSFTAPYADIAVYVDDETVTSLASADSFSFVVLATNANYEAAAEAEEQVAISLTATFDNTVEFADVIGIGEASLTVAPENMILNANNTVTVTLTDASGNPLTGYPVTAGSNEGETDANGQYTFVYHPLGASPLTVAVETDAVDENEDIILLTEEAVVVADTIAPVISAPEVVETDSVTITIEDNVRVIMLRINGEAVNIFPNKVVEVTVTGLTEGLNTIVVEAADNSYNPVAATLTVNYVPPVKPADPVSITVGETNEYVDQAPYIVVTGDGVGRAMVPVRFIANVLGAELDWNAETKTATYTLGDIVVEITAGSTTAVVNGENVALDVAAEITGNRMCVPVRFAAEAFGAKVDYEHSTKTITITPEQ